jgi:3-deoxy-D-manno-octulosonate 8-phosphate phosphatase (KDO 8-P phosphatase)
MMKKEKTIPNNQKKLEDRIRRVKLVAFDADGVLTDGTIYLMPDGRELKAFNALDGTGIKYLERAGIVTAVLSGRRSAAVNRRAREVGTRYVLQGYKRKLAGLAKLARRAKVPPERMCYVGDDLPDIPVMRKVGFAVAVAGARPEVIRAAHWVTERGGGRGAAREVAEKILKAQGKWRSIIARYGL